MSSPAGFEPIAEVTANERAQSGCGLAEELRASLLRGLADVTHGNLTRRDDLLAGDHQVKKIF